MDRKLIAALALCVGIVWFWSKYVLIPPAPHADKAAEQAQPGDAPKKADAPSSAGIAPTAEAKPADGKPEPAPALHQPETFSTVEIPGRLRATLSTWGAGAHDLVLLDPRYQEHTAGHDVPIDLVTSKDAPLPFSITFPESGFTLPPDADWKLERESGDERIYSWSSDAVRVERRWRFVAGTYEAQLEVTVENRGAAPLPASLRMAVTGRQDPEVQPSLFRPQVVQTEAVCSDGKVKRESLSSLLKQPLDVGGAIRVFGVDRKFFAVAVAVAPTPDGRCRAEATKGGTIRVDYTAPKRSIAPGEKASWTFTAFMGPKIVSELDATKIGGADAHFGDLMNYGWTEVIARPMLWVLKTIHRGFGNWGIAIILLTLLLKLLTWWPSAQAMKSAQSMAKLKPEMDKLKEKYGDDKQRMNQEVMALYQKHKINPLGGCLPVLLQMPIYIALYSMLGNSVELYRAGLGLWIHDLTAPDPFFVLPLLTGAIMFAQQKLSPAPPDPSQKTMMTMMPLMFTGMSIFLPSGLTLYILTNTAFSMAQQRITTPKFVGNPPVGISESRK